MLTNSIYFFRSRRGPRRFITGIPVQNMISRKWHAHNGGNHAPNSQICSKQIVTLPREYFLRDINVWQNPEHVLTRKSSNRRHGLCFRGGFDECSSHSCTGAKNTHKAIHRPGTHHPITLYPLPMHHPGAISRMGPWKDASALIWWSARRGPPRLVFQAGPKWLCVDFTDRVGIPQQH